MQKQKNKIDYKFPNPVWFTFRVIILLFISLIFFFLLLDFLREREIIGNVRDLSGDTTFYDRDYYKKSYGSLRDLLYLDDIPDDNNKYYGKYWEIVHAYEHYVMAKDYTLGARAGLDYATALANDEIGALANMAETVVFTENAEKISELLEDLNGL